MRCPSIPETPVTKTIAGALCAYEVVALVTPLPTITVLTKRWPVIGAALIGALVVHFWVPTPQPLAT